MCNPLVGCTFHGVLAAGGLSLHRETNGVAPNSADANKVYVDAQIDLAPLLDTNEVNEALATLDRGEILGLKDMFDMYNNLGCPIDNHCIPCDGECD